MNIRYLILGLLTQKPMTGYDVKTSLEDLKWLVDVPSYGSLYPALHNLLEEGMVSRTIVPKEGKPSRKVYSITQTGTDTLQSWLEQPIEADTSQKGFVMRLLLASNFSREGLIAYLQQRHHQTTAHRTALERYIEIDTPGANTAIDQLVVDYGLAVARTEILWLEGALARLLENAQTHTPLDSPE